MRVTGVVRKLALRGGRFDAVDVGDYRAADIAGFVAYWHDRQTDHVSQMGVCQDRLPSPGAMAGALHFALTRHAADPQAHPLRVVAVRLAGRTVGFHQLTDFDQQGASASMHAYITDPACRGQGVGRVSYAKALALFFDRFALHQIVFDTPLNNAAALRIKTALGIRAEGETRIEQPFLHKPLPARRFCVTPDDLPAILRRAQRV